MPHRGTPPQLPHQQHHHRKPGEHGQSSVEEAEVAGHEKNLLNKLYVISRTAANAAPIATWNHSPAVDGIPTSLPA
jgi:hypothetical protein